MLKTQELSFTPRKRKRENVKGKEWIPSCVKMC